MATAQRSSKGLGSSGKVSKPSKRTGSSAPALFAIRCQRSSEAGGTNEVLLEIMQEPEYSAELNLEDEIDKAAKEHDGSWVNSTSGMTGDILVYTSKQAANDAAAELMQQLLANPPKGFELHACGGDMDEFSEETSEEEEEEEQQQQQQPVQMTADGRAVLQQQRNYWIDVLDFKMAGTRVASTLKVEVVQAVVAA